MATMTTTTNPVVFADTDGEVSFAAGSGPVVFAAGYRAVTTTAAGGAVAGYTPAVSPIVSSYLILGTAAVDGTATEMTLYSADPSVISDSTALPDGLVAFGTFPLGDGSPGANWNYVFDQLAEPSIVVVVGANAGVYRLTPGALDEPWEELDCPIGTFAGFYVSDLVRLLIVRTSYGWKTIDPAARYLTAAEGAVGFGDPWGAADDEYNALSSTALTLSCDGTAAGAWSTSNLGDLPDGIDIRVKVRHHRLQSPTQRYMEILTQQNAANWGGDNFEAAIFTPDNTFGELTSGVPIMFWEHTPDRDLWPTTDGEVGYLADVADYDPPNDVRGEILTADAALSAGEWATLRWVHDTALETVSFYREVPITGDDTTADGREWQLIDSWTWALADSIDSGVTDDWSIGLSALIDVAWLEVYSGPDGTKLADIQPAHLASAGFGATSITDGEANVWTCGGASAVGRVNPVVATAGAHAASHANGGADEVSIDASQVTTGTLDIARVPTGTTGTTVPLGNDSRFSDARTPTAHNHAAGEVTSGTFDIERIPDRPPLQIQVTGRYIRTGDRGGAAAPTTNRVWYIPIWIETACTVDRIAVNHEATTGGASSVARLAIYTNSGNLPGSKVVEATVSTSTAAAVKPATISQALTRGLHWVAMASQPTSGAPTFSWGNPSIMCGDTIGSGAGALFDTSTYSGALPATATVASLATQPPLVYLRIA